MLKDLFHKNKGYLFTKDLNKRRNLYYELKQMVENNEVEKIRPGLYKHNEIVSSNEWIEVCKMYPKGVLCLFSAWHYYELITHIPFEYHLAVPHKSKFQTNLYPPVKLYYWTDIYYELEIEQKDQIRIYSLEKSVCDAVKFRNKVGKDIVAEVFKNYLKRKDKNLNYLIETAKKIRMENLIREYLDILL